MLEGSGPVLGQPLLVSIGAAEVRPMMAMAMAEVKNCILSDVCGGIEVDGMS